MISASGAARAVSVLAPAKLNLFLHVGEKRADEFHALESLVAFAEVADRLTLRQIRRCHVDDDLGPSRAMRRPMSPISF